MVLSTALLSSCFKDYEKRYIFTDNLVEFDDAVINPNISTSSAYPMLATVPMDVGVVRYRVNMTGEQKNKDRKVNFRVVPDLSTAVEGVDYTLPTGNSFIIPANSSFGYVEVEVLPEGSGIPTIVLELLETDDIGVMDRYHRIAFKIVFPMVSPNPSEVEKINDLIFFKNLMFGAQSNDNIGFNIDVEKGNVYVGDGADKNQEKIDFMLLRSSVNEMNFIPPGAPNGTLNAFASSKHMPDEWTVRNAGTFMRLPNPAAFEQEFFDNAQSAADLLNAYDEILANIDNRPAYNSTNDGPSSTRIRYIDQGHIIAFKSSDRNLVALIRVIEMVPGTKGHLIVEMKSAKF